ncbi:glycosyltransferase family 50 protein [Piloderma croceum F 1598]|uniref:GPI mannosyltransferase 1 n=1 Tax=Piloderma croceum (strain F 1598) TaxID=765440 RepID=A0A0C3FJS6_PILCF|nr:glycosyltransferase family 50 protein [Piloderma croceum F 1598]
MPFYFHFPSIHLNVLSVLLISAIVRIALILYSEWHDAHSIVKYTDVDYRVFSDAARYVRNPSPADGNVAKGPCGPYTRETYRYTPLLALLLTPNEWLHPSFGKYLFAACDILNGVLIYKLLVASAQTTSLSRSSTSLATFYTSLHLLNPLVFTISTRGSSESIVTSLVLLTLYCALHDRWDAAAILLGVSTHWKVFPVIYGAGSLGVVGRSRRRSEDKCSIRQWLRTLINWSTVRFGLVSAGTFAALGATCYLIWGYPFLHESYLYHIHRLDHRHNFSPYFYLTYLTYPNPSSSTSLIPPPAFSFLRSPLISFVPQMTLSLGLGLLFGRRKEDLAFTWFVQTAVFVLFNKVCTSQYFLWYLPLLPLLAPHLTLSPLHSALLLGVWIGTQALWLSEAYKLEFLGRDVFWGLWVRSLIYVCGGAWVLGGVMHSYRIGGVEERQ